MAAENPKFSSEETQQIFDMAAQMAEAGEDAIEEARWYRIQTLANAKNFLFRPSPTPLDVEQARSLMHEAKVMGEVIRQASSVLQFRGLDDRSTLDRIAGQQNLQ